MNFLALYTIGDGALKARARARDVFESLKRSHAIIYAFNKSLSLGSRPKKAIAFKHGEVNRDTALVDVNYPSMMLV